MIAIRKKLRIFLLFIIIFTSLFILVPKLTFADDTSNIIITKTNIQEFPRISIYLNFKEGSQLGSEELLLNNFKVLENGNEVQRLSAEKVDTITEPIGVVLAIDTSGSMKGKPIDDAKIAASLFMDQMRQIDKFAIVGFADEIKIYSTFTSNRQILRKSIEQIEAKGETSLFDGISIALDQFAKQNIKYRYLIVLSDGQDTVSKLKVQDDVDKAKQENVVVYSIALISKDYNPTDMSLISSSSGGELLAAANSEELKTLYGAISRKIRNQYKITYTSLWPNSENIKVDIKIEKSGISDSVSTNYINPYYAPAPTKIVNIQRPDYLNLFNIPWVRLIIYAAIFLGIALFFYALVLLVFRPRQILKERMGLYSSRTQDGKKNEEEVREDKSKGKIVDGIVDLVSKVASKRGFVELFNTKLERADLKIRGSEFITLHLISIIILSIGAQFLFRNILVTILIFFIVLLVPFVIVNFKENQKIKKFNDQLPDTLQLISGSMKAGYSFNQAINMVIDETKPPISEEFKRVLNETRMGLPEKEALQNMAVRVNSENLTWTIMAINVQREVGGNLAEVMEIIADTIRERERVMNQIKALTAEGRISAMILIALPILMGLVLTLLNKSYISLLVTTKAGLIMIFGAALLMIIGIYWIIRIIRVKY